MVRPMKHWLAAAAFVFMSIVSIIVVVRVAANGPSSGTVVPDLRGNTPMGDSYDDRGWIRPVLDAGFCVDYLYNSSANRFERDGQFEAVSDTYVIGGEIPEPGSRLPVGSTVTVIVGGSPMVGAGTDWDEVPVVCPGACRVARGSDRHAHDAPANESRTDLLDRAYPGDLDACPE
jgi:hypothetical protein